MDLRLVFEIVIVSLAVGGWFCFWCSEDRNAEKDRTIDSMRENLDANYDAGFRAGVRHERHQQSQTYDRPERT